MRKRPQKHPKLIKFVGVRIESVSKGHTEGSCDLGKDCIRVHLTFSEPCSGVRWATVLSVLSFPLFDILAAQKIYNYLRYVFTSRAWVVRLAFGQLHWVWVCDLEVA